MTRRGAGARGGRRGVFPSVRAFNPDSIANLVLDLDASDLSAGAVTSWTDRKNGYVFSGTATRNAIINNKPTVTFNGSSDILSTAGNISQFGNVDACTFVIVAIDVNTGNDRIVFEVGDGTQQGGQLVLAAQYPVPTPAVILTNVGNVGYNQSSIAENWASPGVLTAVNDFSASGTAETSTLRWNGTTPTVTNIAIPNNSNQCAALRMHLGARVGPSLFWPGSIAKLLAYNRRLTTAEMQYLESNLMLAYGFADPYVRWSDGTFTRTSEGSYYTQAPGGAGSTFIAWAGSNVLRYDAIDGTPLALFEGSQTNLCNYSEDLNQASWTKTGASISGTTATAPDGDADCNTVAFTASASDSVMRTVTGTADNTSYVTTVFARRTSGSGNVRLRVLKRDGVASLSADLAISTTWTRLEYVVNWGTGATTPEVGIINDAAGTAQSVEVWGFDVKSAATVGSFASSYIRTTNGSATRNADVLTYASAPQVMATGKWRAEIRPLRASSETVNPTGGNSMFHFAAAAESFVGLTTTSANAISVGATAFTKGSLVYSRHQPITLTPDCASFTMTVAGATSGDGTGAIGTNPSYGTAYLRIGSSYTGARVAYARIGEPYAA